jgi:hypothetical protein
VEPTLFLLPNALSAFAGIDDHNEGLTGVTDKPFVLVLNTDYDLLKQIPELLHQYRLQPLPIDYVGHFQPRPKVS